MSSLTQQWLRQVSQNYQSKDRVYSDVDGVLSTIATLRPKTEMYTFNDGRTQLLICIHGLLPISYRQATYNIPVALWIPLGYPREPPLAYVVPTSDMFVRSSNAVDPSGQCDVEYLRNWQRKSEGCDIVGLVRALQDQFSLEPPVYAKSRPAAGSVAPKPQPPNISSPGRPPPPLPGSHSPSPSTSHAHAATSVLHDDRPALPLKPYSHSPSSSVASAIPSTQQPQRPALPPISSDFQRPSTQSPPYSTTRPGGPMARPASAYATFPQQYSVPGNTGGPVPPQLTSFHDNPYAPAMHSTFPGPVSPATTEQPQHVQPIIASSYVVHSPQPTGRGSRPTSIHASTFPHTAPVRHSPIPVVAMPPPSTAPVHDFLDDDNLELSSTSGIPAPPRPPNPELLRLHGAVRAKIYAELASISASANADAERMRVTQMDLLAGEPAIQDEMARLHAVKDVCRTVVSRLRESVTHAEINIAELRRKGDPEVDELVCSTTIVHNQLINLIAEDNAIEDTIYHLHRALNAGRIDLDRFLKTTRLLAEEQFTKRALIERILADLPIGSSLGWT